jgi:predicted dienelactone hydrolase
MRRHTLVTLALLFATHATAYEAPQPPSCETGILPDASQLTATCNVLGRGCAYRSPKKYRVLDLGDWSATYPAVGYTAPAERTVDLKVRVPRQKPNQPPAPLPVVIFSHGGADGAAPGHGQNKLEEWARTVVKAGYAAINIGHQGRTIAEQEALCATLGLTTTPPNADPTRAGGDCGLFKFLGYDRPHDIALVLDRIDDGSLEAQYAIDLDPAQIVVAGHSAGAGGAEAVAGARRLIGGILRDYSDPRPRAFMGFSPQGPTEARPPDPGSEGWIDSSFGAMLDRPFFTATGTGDNPDGEDPLTRRDAHYVMASDPPAPRYQLFVCDPSIEHGNYALEEPAPARFERLLKGAALAFLDAVVKGLPDAQAWIDHENAQARAKGVAEWNARTWTPVEMGLVYVPATHRTAQVPLEVWYPAGRTGALPVVLWSHGGGTVADEFNDLSERWLATFASAGYVAVKVNTLDRDVSGPRPDFTHCDAYGYGHVSGECLALSAASPLRDRALDAIAALDALPTIALPTGATLDPTRVAAGGWSGGSGMPLALGGATRDLMDPVAAFAAGLLTPVPGVLVDFAPLITAPAPLAYVALSPPGGYPIGAFRDAALLPSYDGITAPALIATGAGDVKPNEHLSVADRLVPYDSMTAARQFQLFINSPAATHDTFNLGNEDYPQYNAWLAKAVLTFLDAELKGDTAAEGYLYSTWIPDMVEADPSILPGGVRPTWSTR